MAPTTEGPSTDPTMTTTLSNYSVAPPTHSNNLEKSIFLVGMLIITFGASIIPKGMVTYRWIGELPLRLCSCFAGGVFFGALLLDLLPDALGDWNEAMNGENYEDFFRIPCIGFFMVFIVEQLILAYRARQANNNNNEEYSPLLGQNDDSHDGHSHVDFGHHCIIRTMILQLALSFHSIMEGMAIGLQTNMSSFLVLFLAVCAHKFVMAFCLGLTLAKTKISNLVFMTLMVIFSLASPFGMLIGMILSDVNAMVTAVLQALAGGTFLYVTFFEVLPQEFNHSQDSPSKRLMKCGSVLFGFILMGVLVYFSG